MPLTVEQFTERITSSGVLPNEQLSELLAGLPADAKARSDAEALARELVKQKKLTRFQAEQIYAGKGASLSLGNYLVLDKLGEGGMGMVLKAWHRRMERTVALKVINPKVLKEQSALKRFQREVIAAAKLTHPNIVAAYDADEAKGTHFLVMEYVEGSDLSSWVKEHGPLPVEEAVSCIIQAARGLSFAHDKGVVHRDIKPHNLLRDNEGGVKILDMGLARIEGGFGGSAEQADLTRSGAMMGTVDYMSPEQAMDSKHADARSDIYSLGCTLFYLITGHVAFEADTVMKRLTAHQSAPPPSLAELSRVGRGTRPTEESLTRDGGSRLLDPPYDDDNMAALPEHLVALNTVFQRMVAKKPDDRPQSMLQVIAELERCLTGGSATVSVASGSNPVARPSAPTKAPANVPNRDADTIIDSSSDSKTNGPSDATVVLDSSVVKNPAEGATTTSIKSRKMILISAATVVVLLVIAWAMSGKSGKPPAESDKEVAQGEKTSGGDPVASSPANSTDYALVFDGDDLVSMESVPEYSTESMTLEAFVRVDSIPKEVFIYSLGGNGGLQIRGDGRRWWFAMVGLQGGWFFLESPEPIQQQRRVHLAGVCDKSEFRLYVDGQLIGQPRSTMGWQFKPPGGAAAIGLNLCGTIDEVRVSKVARYSAAFTPAARHESDADTLALYHCDEGQGDRLVDSSGNNHHGKIIGAKWVKADEGSAIGPALAKAPFDAAQARTHQEAWAKHLGTTVETTNSVGAKMILIPPGEFLMGTSDGQIAAVLKEVAAAHGQEFADRMKKAEQPQHRVTLTKPFWMGATEVTIGQFRKFVEATKHQTYAEKVAKDEKSWTYLKLGYAVTDESPAAAVTRDDALAYCHWLSQQEQAIYRLPTEAEWEYACRGGTTTAYSVGDRLLDTHEWSIQNSDVKAHAVATRQPNPFRLFDMHGNLSEWCQDLFDENWYAQSPATDPVGPILKTNATFAVRGGNWDYNSQLHCAFRVGMTHNIFHYTIGFRVVREIGVQATPPAKKISTDRRAAEWVIAQGGEVTLSGRQPWIATVNDLPEGDLEVRLIKFKRRLSGDDADLVPLRELKQLEFVGIDYTHPTPAGITALARLPKLERVSCGGQPLSDEQVTALARLNNVTSLFLAGAQLKPAQCAILAKSMPQVRSLNLMNNPLLDDASVASLEGMPNLKKLQLQGTKVTALGVAKLRQTLPNCDFEWDGAATSANGPTTAPGGVVDLLALVDVKRDVLAGEWSREPNGLKVKQSESTIYVPRLQLPYQPPEEYDYEIEFTQGNGNGTVEQLLSAQSRSFAWVLNVALKDGVKAGVDTLDGMNLVNRKDASVMRPKLLEPGRRYRSRVEVRKGKLRAFLDDELLVEWGGDFQRLDIIPRTALRDKLHLGLAANDRGALFHKVTVREVSGAGKLTSGVAGSEANSAWTDWLGPRLKHADFFSQFDGRVGWQREGDAITTTQVISGQEVIRGKTRDGAVRLTYLLRDAKGIVINACDRSVNNMRELYVAEDHGTQISITLARGGVIKVLVKEPIPASIPRDAQRTLEFRIAGDTLTATFNGSVVATVKDTTLTEGNFALVALKGVLVQKVEYQRLDDMAVKAASEVDVLAKVDVKRDATADVWKVENGTLRVTTGATTGSPKVFLPIDNLPAEYDLRLQAQRVSEGNALVLGLVIGSRRVAVVMDGFRSRGGLWGLEQIDGKGPADNGTAVMNQPLKVNESTEVLVQVRKIGIRVEREGKQLFDWKGSAEQFSLNTKWDDNGPPRYFLGAQGDFVISRLTFQPVGTQTVALSERGAALWALEHEKSVEIALGNGGEPQTIKSGEALPNEPFTVRGLNLGGHRRVTDADLKELLPSRSQLKSVNFGNAVDATDAGLALLAEQPQLEMLILSPATKLSDQTVEKLTVLKQLKSLSLLNPSLTSSHFQQALRISSLEGLSFGGALSLDDFVQLNQRLPKLTFLAIRGDTLNEAAGQELAKHGGLTGINLTDGSNAGTIKGAARLKQLKGLSIAATKPIAAADWLPLKLLTQLQSLYLVANVPEEAVNELQQALPNCKLTVSPP